MAERESACARTRRRCCGLTRVSALFPHALTPQRRHLLQQTYERIGRRSLRTSDLQLTLLHFREAKLQGWVWECASSIAHVMRDQGIFWAWGLSTWATNLYYQRLDRQNIDVSLLPMDVFTTVRHLIEAREEWQLCDELSHIYPAGVSKVELLATLDHLYREKPEKGGEPAFVQLNSRGGHFREDMHLMRFLVSYCEQMALSIRGMPIDPIVDAIEEAFRFLAIARRRFTPTERTYLELHILVSLHNVLLNIRRDVFKSIAHEEPPSRQAMLSVSAMDSTLTVDVGFYFWEGTHLEQDNLFSPDRFERFRCPLIQTSLDEETFLLESDMNIRCCLFNHPLEVRKHPTEEHYVIVALERQSAGFRTTKSRRGPREY